MAAVIVIFNLNGSSKQPFTTSHNGIHFLNLHATNSISRQVAPFFHDLYRILIAPLSLDFSRNAKQDQNVRYFLVLFGRIVNDIRCSHSENLIMFIFGKAQEEMLTYKLRT